MNPDFIWITVTVVGKCIVAFGSATKTIVLLIVDDSVKITVRGSIPLHIVEDS